MKLLLVQNALYIPTHGGANKVNRVVMESLAARGHACRAVVRAHAVHRSTAAAPLLRELAARDIPVSSITPDAVVFELGGVEIHAVVDASRLTSYVKGQIAEFMPDWTLVASEDPGQALLEVSLPRAIYIAQTTLLLPFGPGGFAQYGRGAEFIRRAAAVITVSEYLREYLQRWGGITATVMRPPIFGRGPFPRLGGPDKPFVTVINPCAVKGIDIFLGVAAAMPDVAFAAVLGWGTTARDEQALRRLPNVRLLKPVDDLRPILAETRALLVPSLWAEAFGCVSVEAMLHGIPVLASNIGGLPEAKLGVDYLLPVRPIEKYDHRFDERLTPVPIIPEQDCQPWIDALRSLVGDSDCYERVATRSRAAALAAVEAANVDAVEQLIERLESSLPVLP